MTSIPASRSAAATTLAPRSWPSRPGLATRTRIGLIERIKLEAASVERQSVLLLPRDEQHLRRRSRQRTVGETVECLLDDQPGAGEQLGEPRRRVQPDAVLPLPGPSTTFPGRVHGEQAGQRIELALLCKECPV